MLTGPRRGTALACLVALAALAALLGACGSSDGHAAVLGVPPAAVPAATSSHVVVVVMENKEERDVLGSRDAPYLTRLARRYARLSQSYGVRHPSLPNYLALTSGSTHGVSSDCTSCNVDAPNLVDQLEARRIGWKAYMGGLPRRCFTGRSSGGYKKKHDPFMYFDSVRTAPERCRKVVPFTELAADLRGGRLPAFAWITPDMCSDTHDCGVATGDRFLAGLVPALLRAVGPQGYVVVTYDEGDSGRGCCGAAKGGRIATVVAGPSVRRGAVDAAPIDHYGVLRTIEDTFGLPRLGAARDARNGAFTDVFLSAPHLP